MADDPNRNRFIPFRKADIVTMCSNDSRMKTIDKLIIGVPAAVSGIIVIVTKLSATLILIGSVFAFWLGLSKEEAQLNQKHLIALGAGLATLGGFLFRQISKFRRSGIRSFPYAAWIPMTPSRHGKNTAGR